MIKVNAKCISPADENGAMQYIRKYTQPEGLECIQRKDIQRESDYVNGVYIRKSPDNGRTWSDWEEEAREETSIMYGEDERTLTTIEVWNPVHKHYVGTVFSRYFLNGHEDAYHHLWNTGKRRFFDHQYCSIRLPDEDKPHSVKLIKYEDGDDFDTQNPGNMNHLTKNNGFLNDTIVLSNGDIAVPVGATVETGCRIAGLDVNTVFPSCPIIHRCVIVARGKYNEAADRYDFTFSNPIILSDLRSSRGIDEPRLAELKSGRLLLVMRGSNVQSANWNTRIEKGTPSFKWYAYSDDGGKTFTTAEPWHFDDGEVIYSSATISSFIRSSKNGKLYWFGNITSHNAYGNWPRFPLNMVEVDEETGMAKKSSLTVIDTQRDGESDQVQLSNFELLEDRETNNIELTLCKICQHGLKKPFYCESWQYVIELD